MGCCDSFARFLLIVFNLIFWLTGAAILGVGIWFLVDKNINSYFDVLQVDTDDPYFKYAAYILIAFGGFVFLVGFCGCCGAIRGSKCLLGFYIFFLILIIAGEIAAAALMIVYRVEVEDKVDSLLMKSLKKYPNSSSIATSWDFVQIEFECCGALGPDDYKNVSLPNNKVFPLTCCTLDNRNEAMENPSTAVAKNATLCMQKTNTYFYNKGCKSRILDLALQYSTVIIAVGFGIGVLEFFGIVFAICLCRQAGKDDN